MNYSYSRLRYLLARPLFRNHQAGSCRDYLLNLVRQQTLRREPKSPELRSDTRLIVPVRQRKPKFLLEHHSDTLVFLVRRYLLMLRTLNPLLQSTYR
jgi:hypothetical protein